MIDYEKFTKYSKPGPRYTSYPTAVEFGTAYTYEDHVRSLANIEPHKDLSLYIHLPFCRSACYFCGCNVIYTSKSDGKTRYISYLKKELAILSGLLDTQKTVSQLHFGGGTPTFFSADELDEILVAIKGTFPNFSAGAEISCEIDPRFFDEPQMKVLAAHGFNRLSFGVQDLDPEVQKAVHRVQPLEISASAVDLARKYGIKSINVDLIYGLPYQDLEKFKHTLEKTVSLDPDRIAIFNYAHVPWIKKTMRKINENTLPTPAVKLEIFKFATDFLTQNGYEMIGMDHFAKPGDELFSALQTHTLHRNFQGYTTKGANALIGIGLTSIGNGTDWYAQNTKDMKLYEASLDSGRLPLERGLRLGADDLLRKRVIMELMANFYLDIRALEREFSIDFASYFASALEDLRVFESEGLVKLTDDFLAVDPTGRLLIRNIAMCFDAYLKSKQNVFSKTI